MKKQAKEENKKKRSKLSLLPLVAIVLVVALWFLPCWRRSTERGTGQTLTQVRPEERIAANKELLLRFIDEGRCETATEFYMKLTRGHTGYKHYRSLSAALVSMLEAEECSYEVEQVEVWNAEREKHRSRRERIASLRIECLGVFPLAEAWGVSAKEFEKDFSPEIGDVRETDVDGDGVQDIVVSFGLRRKERMVKRDLVDEGLLMIVARLKRGAGYEHVQIGKVLFRGSGEEESYREFFPVKTHPLVSAARQDIVLLTHRVTGDGSDNEVTHSVYSWQEGEFHPVYEIAATTGGDAGAGVSGSVEYKDLDGDGCFEIAYGSLVQIDVPLVRDKDWYTEEKEKKVVVSLKGGTPVTVSSSHRHGLYDSEGNEVFDKLKDASSTRVRILGQAQRNEFEVELPSGATTVVTASELKWIGELKRSR